MAFFLDLPFNSGEAAKCSGIAPRGHKQGATSGQKHAAHGHKYTAHGHEYATNGQKYAGLGGLCPGGANLEHLASSPD